MGAGSQPRPPCLPAFPHPVPQSLTLEGRLDKLSHGDSQKSHSTPQDHNALLAEPSGESNPNRVSSPNLFHFSSPPLSCFSFLSYLTTPTCGPQDSPHSHPQSTAELLPCSRPGAALSKDLSSWKSGECLPPLTAGSY